MQRLADLVLQAGCSRAGSLLISVWREAPAVQSPERPLGPRCCAGAILSPQALCHFCPFPLPQGHPTPPGPCSVSALPASVVRGLSSRHRNLLLLIRFCSCQPLGSCPLTSGEVAAPPDPSDCLLRIVESSLFPPSLLFGNTRATSDYFCTARFPSLATLTVSSCDLSSGSAVVVRHGGEVLCAPGCHEPTLPGSGGKCPTIYCYGSPGSE